MIRGVLKKVPIENVHVNDYNHNEMSPELLEKEKKALEKFGIVRSILVRTPRKNHHIVIDGEHRLGILKEKQCKLVPIRDLGNITEEEAKTLTIVLDEIKGQPDYVSGAAMFASLQSVTIDEISDLLPYKPAEIRSMIDAINFDIEEYGNVLNQDDEDEYITICCRVEKSESGFIDDSLDTLSTKLRIKDSKEPVKYGKVLLYLLGEKT